jgi:hypothetical protein
MSLSPALNVHVQIYRSYILCRGGVQRLFVPFLVLLWAAMAGTVFLPTVNVMRLAEHTLNSGTGLTNAFLCTIDAYESGGDSNLDLLSPVFYCLTAAIQLLTTAAITFTLLRHKRVLARMELGARGGIYGALARLLIESAALYTAVALLYALLEFFDTGLSDVLAGSIAIVANNLVVSLPSVGVISSDRPTQFLNPAFLALRVAMGTSTASGMPTTSGQSTVLRFAAAELHIEDELASADEAWSSDKGPQSAAQVPTVELNAFVGADACPLRV